METLQLLKKHKSIIVYLFFGVCTTVVNIVVYAVSSRVLLLSTMISTCIAWMLAVVFAYLTNRKWVFGSKAREKEQVLKEIFSFFVCRLVTGFLDVGMMYVFADKIGINDILMKMISNVIVIIVNYVASKSFVFARKD